MVSHVVTHMYACNYFQRFLIPRGRGQLVDTRRRLLHLWRSRGQPEGTVLDGIIPHEVSQLALGVGFISLFAPFKHSHLWLHYYDRHMTSSSDTDQWNHLNLTSEATAVKQVCCGQSHMIVLATSGEVFSFGSNEFSQCGVPRSESCDLIKIQSVPGCIQQISCGLDHTLFLTDDGRVWSCGWSTDGQTGTGECSAAVIPTPVVLPTTHHHGNRPNVRQIFAGGDTSFALTDDGEVFGWGNNEYGQLGEDTPTDQVSNPVSIDCSMLDGKVVSIATGGAFTGFLTSNASVYIAGYGIEDASLSHNPETGKLLPPSVLCCFRQLHSRSLTDRVTIVSAGLNYLLASTAAGSQLTWGLTGSRDDIELYLKQSNLLSYSCGPCELAVLLK